MSRLELLEERDREERKKIKLERIEKLRFNKWYEEGVHAI